MFCSKCGASVPAGATFCSNCGQPVAGYSVGQPNLRSQLRFRHLRQPIPTQLLHLLPYKPGSLQ